VEIQDQVAERDEVTTRKTIRETHQGILMGSAPTGRQVEIQVIDVVRLRDGRCVEHWGINTLPIVLAQLRETVHEN
jgi:predicted ester cyclase